VQYGNSTIYDKVSYVNCYSTSDSLNNSVTRFTAYNIFALNPDIVIYISPSLRANSLIKLNSNKCSINITMKTSYNKIKTADEKPMYCNDKSYASVKDWCLVHNVSETSCRASTVWQNNYCGKLWEHLDSIHCTCRTEWMRLSVSAWYGYHPYCKHTTRFPAGLFWWLHHWEWPLATTIARIHSTYLPSVETSLMRLQQLPKKPEDLHHDFAQAFNQRDQ
jgi:hypothetical protein